MPQYIYRAKNAGLKMIEGTIEADSETAAINRLGDQGVFPLSIIEAGSVGRSQRRRRGRVSVLALSQMTRQLADLLGGGLPLFASLNLLSRQTEQPRLQAVAESLASSVREGHSFSEALTDHPDIFQSLYVSMIRAGEVGGDLEQALSRLADLGEYEAEVRGKLVNAMAYPCFVLVTAAAMTGFLVAYVIPTLSEVFVDSGQLLPVPTRILMALSGFVVRWWWALGVALVAGFWIFRQWARSPAGKAVVDRTLLAAPGIGALIRKRESARVVRNLGSMISQGVPVLQALDVVVHNISNIVIRTAVVQVRQAVQDGSSIAAALTASRQFPAFVSNMVAVGEESGTVDRSLIKVAVTYEREIDRTIRTLTTILEPLLLIFVGGVVMFIVLAMLLPIFQIGLVVQ